MIRHLFGRWVFAVLTGLLMVPTASAQSVTISTLEKIRSYRTIYVGHREASIPFSYLVGDEAVGYSMDLCDRVVEAVKDAVDDPALRVVRVPVTSSSRMLMLLVGAIDLECGSTTNTKIRQHQVAFGVSTFVSGIRAAVRKDTGINRLADLDGKVVVTTAGTTTERVVRTVMATRNASARFKSARDHAESLAIVVSRQADTFVMDDAILAGLLANSPDADKLKLLDENFGFEPYGIVMRKEDPEFKKLVDETLKGLMKNGELEKIYHKWFMSPIPPKNVNLRIPMSDTLKELIRNPNDSGI